VNQKICRHIPVSFLLVEKTVAESQGGPIADQLPNDGKGRS
jgi:hypothetical protein